MSQQQPNTSVAKIEQLIINNPFEAPKNYWKYERETRRFFLDSGRRPAGYVVATSGSRSFDDPGVFVPIELVNVIRPRVDSWRANGYPGVTGITKRLLEHWNNPEEREGRRFFFCQLEAMETLIWLAEGPDSEKVGIEIPSDGGLFKRLCCKLATGSGKTIVMAMVIAWQVLNKITYPQDPRFAKNVFIMAPGRTVRSRLEVLKPSSLGNYYDEFNIVPPGLFEKLRQGKVMIKNWQACQWDTEEKLAKKKTVDKRGAKSDEAYVRDVLEDMANAHNILVINDEAHHAWRVPAESKVKGVKKEDLEEATKWVGSLDRIHNARKIHCCYDFSATPFAPTGKRTSEEALFPWIVSDFGLNDAIESGLVKTPRVVVRDDGTPSAHDYRSRLYHIYADHDVYDDINRPAEETDPLPALVINAYYLLGLDWLETLKTWQSAGVPTPPVMITVANTTETAARVKYAFDHNKILIDELYNPQKTLHIDSKVLNDAESSDEPVTVVEETDPDETNTDNETPGPKKLTKKQMAELLRLTVDTVGQRGKPGEQIQNVISVGMLSEGWDAKTVTHIMGLRAFTSQLLCEQVVGRGLRRTSYETNPDTGLFEAEYVNIFGVPFTFLPHEESDGPPPPPPSPKTRIEPDPDKSQYEITWPNITRLDTVYRPTLSLDFEKVQPLVLNPADTIQLAELAPIVEGKPDFTKIEEIKLLDLAKKFRMQKFIFEAARDIYDRMQPGWKGSREYLLAQLIGLVEEFMQSGKIEITQPLFYQDDLKRRLLFTLNMSKIVQHIWEAIRFDNTESIEPIFDKDHPIRSTGDMRTWYTSKPCEFTNHSHINFCVCDSGWESTEEFKIDRSDSVDAWVKNDHLGFEVHYIFNGVVKKYRPDFIIKLSNGTFLVLETKGRETQKDTTKRAFLNEWVNAVNRNGGFGAWHAAVSTDPADIDGILQTYASQKSLVSV